MKLSNLLNRLFSRRVKRPALGFVYKYNGPIDGLLTSYIALAWATGANALILGMPLGLSQEQKEEAQRIALQEIAEIEATTQNFIEATTQTIPASTRLRSSSGWVSIWLQVGNDYFLKGGCHVSQLISFLHILQDRLVSLDASAAEPKPVRYIEYTVFTRPEDPQVRRFAEIELWMDENNTFRIEILGHRTEPMTVYASRYTNG